MSTDMQIDPRLEKLAELCISVGVALQPGQALVVTAPLEAAPFVEMLTAHAYRSAGGPVTCLFEHPEAIRDALRYADAATLDQAPDWLWNGVADALRGGAARLSVLGPSPDLLSGVSVDRIMRLHDAMRRATAAEARLMAERSVNASMVPFATASWARSLYPEASPAEARNRLWNTIYAAARADRLEPAENLQQFLKMLDTRRDKLNELGLSALQFHDGHTDLRVGLAAGSGWTGATATAGNGVNHAPSLVPGELLAAVHRDSADGVVALPHPLVVAGAHVTEARLEFHRGQVVSVWAAQGQATLEHLLDTDPGAQRIGEIGLAAPADTAPRAGLICGSPLLDRATHCHVALGRPDHACATADSAPMHINDSSMHLDLLLDGSGLDVDGVETSGRRTPIIRDARFVL